MKKIIVGALWCKRHKEGDGIGDLQGRKADSGGKLSSVFCIYATY